LIPLIQLIEHSRCLSFIVTCCLFYWQVSLDQGCPTGGLWAAFGLQSELALKAKLDFYKIVKMLTIIQ